MILTFTPNPALDLGGLVDRVLPNEKTYVSEETRFPGGNAINAGRIIHTLQGTVRVSGFLGGSTGQEINELLKREGVQTRFLPIRDSTRINVTVTEKVSHLQTRLSFPGPRILVSEVRQAHQLVHSLDPSSLFLIGGSLPQGFGIPQLKTLLQTLNQKKIPWIIDSPGPVLREILRLKPLLVKPNLIEFQDLIGTKVTRLSKIVSEAKRLSLSRGWICVSSVEGGAVLIHSTGRAFYGRAPKVKIRGHVGAGDSMVGAMAMALQKSGAINALQPDQGPNLLRLGLAAAAATLMEPGTRLGQRKNILRLYESTRVVEVK